MSNDRDTTTEDLTDTINNLSDAAARNGDETANDEFHDIMDAAINDAIEHARLMMRYMVWVDRLSGFTAAGTAGIVAFTAAGALDPMLGLIPLLLVAATIGGVTGLIAGKVSRIVLTVLVDMWVRTKLRREV